MRMKLLFLTSMLFALSGCGAKAEDPQYVSIAMHQEFLENGMITSTYDYHSPVDDRGLVTGVEEYQDGVLQFRSSFEYDEYGNIISVTEERDGTVKASDYKNTLDAQGRILRQEIWIGDTMTSFEEHAYDKKGNEIRHYQSTWNEVEQIFDWRSHTMEYDWKGNLCRKELHWNFNNEYTVWEYENGHCIRQTSYQEGTDQVTEKLENSFDANGNHTKKTYHNPITDNVTDYWEYDYDKQGRCIRETKYRKNGEPERFREYHYDDAARTKTSILYHPDGTVDGVDDIYTYDEYGNEILHERIHDGEVYWRISYTYELLDRQN